MERPHCGRFVSKDCTKIPKQSKICIFWMRTISSSFADYDDIMSRAGRCQHDFQTMSGNVFKNCKILSTARIQKGMAYEMSNFLNEVLYESSNIAWWKTFWSCEIFIILKGDVVGLVMENRLEYTCYWLGLSYIGVIPALVNSNLRYLSYLCF